VTLAAGTNITITANGQTLTISAATPIYYMMTAPVGYQGAGGDVYCSPGDTATGGGVKISAGEVVSSYPLGNWSNPNGWHGSAFDFPTNQPATTYVICLDRTP
jgi:hypothetical protein